MRLEGLRVPIVVLFEEVNLLANIRPRIQCRMQRLQRRSSFEAER